ncbi:MAG: hypothetical protein MUW56_09460 [Chryseobacterium sp.]|uniref:hypothetical protein n=1 Tax=Chryseobacterium sp. TaxID=1871047 RepID=UPI0025C6C5F4|nr:hypothetical protein [Chryseobacterium sp.]MCJ7933844.1 hypothetical protein [Chryseobacterium sp.]
MLTLTDKVASAMAQGLVHGFSQGILSMMQGANFAHGFASGASLFGGLAGSFANSVAGTVVSGMVLGGVGSELTGGNFWQGALIGGVVAGLNHTMHAEKTAVEDNDDGDCPTCPKNAKQWQTYTTNNYNAFDKEFWTWDQFMKQDLFIHMANGMKLKI